VLAVAAGAVGVAVGLGVGLRHLIVAGPSVAAGLGVAVLVAAAPSIVFGASVLLRAVPRGRRWVSVPVALTVVWFGVWPLTVAVMATHVPPTRLGAATPADRGVAYRDVTFTTPDGVRSSAWYVPSRNDAAVVLRHGATSTRSATLDHLVVLARHGYGVLATDARGHGRSGGAGMDLGWYGDADVAGGVTYLARRPEVDGDRIGVVGLSMGGEEAIGAAASDRRIRAVVAEGASGRGVVADDDLVLPDHPGRWLNIAQTWIQERLTDVLSDAAPPRGLRQAVAATAPRHVLLVTAGAAAGGEATAGQRLAAAAPATVEAWHVRDAPHTGALETKPRRWEVRVTGFLGATLTARPVAARPAASGASSRSRRAQ
jgi:dienelactone hydrolase